MRGLILFERGFGCFGECIVSLTRSHWEGVDEGVKYNELSSSSNLHLLLCEHGCGAVFNSLLYPSI